jgi:hypothetical protein
MLRFRGAGRGKMIFMNSNKHNPRDFPKISEHIINISTNTSIIIICHKVFVPDHNSIINISNFNTV